MSPSACVALFSAAAGATTGLAAALFFTRFAIVLRATPVARAMLRNELRSSSSWSTCAYCRAFSTAAGWK